MKASSLEHAAKLHRAILSTRELRRKLMSDANFQVYLGGLNHEYCVSLPGVLASLLIDQAELGLAEELRTYGVTL